MTCRQLLPRLQFRLRGPRGRPCVPGWCATCTERRAGAGRVGEGCLRFRDPLLFALDLTRTCTFRGACNTPGIAPGNTQILARMASGEFLPLPLALSTGIEPFRTPTGSYAFDCQSRIIFTSEAHPVSVYPLQQPIDCDKVRLLQDYCVHFPLSGPDGICIFREGRGKHGREVFGSSCENVRVSVNHPFSCEGMRREKGQLETGGGICGW